MKKLGYGTLIAVCMAISLLIAGATMGGFDELKSLYEHGDLKFSLPFIDTINVTQEFEGINNIDIEADAGKIEFYEYDGDVIRVEGKNVSDKIEISKHRDTLMIKDVFKWLTLGNVGDDNKLTVYLPRDYQLDNVDFDIDAGLVTVEHLKAKNIDINIDAGAIEADSIISGYIRVDVDAGKATIDYLDSYDSDFECDVGAIEVIMRGKEVNYSYKASCDAGDVKIGSYQNDGVSDKYTKHGGKRKINVDVDAGSIEILMED